MSNQKKPEGFEVEQKVEAQVDRDFESELQELREEYESLKTQLDAAEAEAIDLNNQLTEDPLAWLEENCKWYEVTINNETGKCRLRGELSSKLSGYYERLVPKVFRSNGKPPYLIHKDSTFKVYQPRAFDLIDMDLSVHGLVDKLKNQLPGDVKLSTQNYLEDRDADYGNVRLWVVPAEKYELDLDAFSKLQTVSPEHVVIYGL